MNFKARGYECANNEHLLYGKSNTNVRIDSSQSNVIRPKSSMKMMLPRSIRSRPTAPRHRTLPTPLVRQIGNRQPAWTSAATTIYEVAKSFCQRPTIAFFSFCFPSLSAVTSYLVPPALFQHSPRPKLDRSRPCLYHSSLLSRYNLHRRPPLLISTRSGGHARQHDKRPRRLKHATRPCHAPRR